MLISKFALTHVCLFSITAIVLSLDIIETNLFNWPYYDYVGITSDEGPRSFTPRWIWIFLVFSIPSLWLSFFLSSKQVVHRSASIVISNFASIFDMITDLLVIYTWILSGHIS